MKYQYYDKYIIKNKNDKYDVTPLFSDPRILNKLLTDLFKPFKKTKIDKIAGIDSLGFIIGGALSQKYKIGFIPIRKKGKIPGENKNKIVMKFKDYSNSIKGLEIRKNSIKKEEKILIVDEWIETGTQAKTAAKLIEKLGGKVSGITAINLDYNKKTKYLLHKYNCKPLNISSK